jgi:hypothetical protein
MGGVMLVVGAGLARNIGVVEAQKSVDPIMPPLSQQPSRPGMLPSDDPEPPEDMGGPMRARMKEERVNLLNEVRHKRLEDDAEKLLALSTELKTDVDKANKDELSLDVMHKAAEIEKLAHDVQSRMKN